MQEGAAVGPVTCHQQPPGSSTGGAEHSERADACEGLPVEGERPCRLQLGQRLLQPLHDTQKALQTRECHCEVRSLPFNSFLTSRCELTRTRKDVWHWLLLCALHRQAMPCSGDVMVWCCNGICILHLPVQSSTLCPGQHETHMFGSFVPLTLVHQMRRPSELAKVGCS